MNEPVVPQPIPEARPPHLPDVVTRRPLVVAFGLVAAFDLWIQIQNWFGRMPISEPLTLASLLVSVIPSVVIPLLGVALFVRHPDARRTMPLLVVGLGLLALGELLSALDEPISRFLVSLSPPDDSLTSPANVAYSVFTRLLSVVAVLYLGAGLSAARRREGGPAERPLLIWLVALSIVGAVVSLAGIALGGFELTPSLLVQVGLGLVLSLLLSVTWAYLTAVTIGGWLAGDEPRRAWQLVAIGVSVLFVIRLLGSAIYSLPTGLLEFLAGLSYLSFVAWLMLLVAFWLGLPTLPAEEVVEVDVDAVTADPPAATTPGSAAG